MLLLSSNSYAQNFPSLTGRVVDNADLLSPADEAALVAKLEALEQNSRRQLVVATLSGLEGYDIADYSNRLFRHWKLGQSAQGNLEKDNGVLLIIAPNERKMRIEVGYGLEPYLTDGLSGSIIRNDITPLFKANDYAGGINAGVNRIAKQLTLPPDQAREIAAQANAKRASDPPDTNMVIFWLFIFFFFILPMLRSIFGGSKSYRRSGYSSPVIIWGGGSDWGGGSGSSWGGGGGFGGFGGGGGSSGGGGASGGW